MPIIATWTLLKTELFPSNSSCLAWEIDVETRYNQQRNQVENIPTREETWSRLE
jgi:hypothetical protein